MRVRLIFIVCLMVGIGMAQSENVKVTPIVTTVPIEDGAVTVLHLGLGFTTSVRLPEEISSVVIGNPATFKAEHSEAEPRLVFLKPITAQPCESNALITTKSGQEITLHLVSAGKASTNAHVDFLVEYRRPQSMVIDSDRQSFLISETRPVSPVTAVEAPTMRTEQPDLIAKELEEQRGWSSPVWEGTELLAAVGKSIQQNNRTILGLSILNSSKRVIELLPPQLELSGTGHGTGGKRIKAEPIAITEYRMTARRLAPGQRTDGVVVFERPAFKESGEKLRLRLAEAEQVDRPILLPVPFTANSQGGAQ
jgi:hypothetical protein